MKREQTDGIMEGLLRTVESHSQTRFLGTYLPPAWYEHQGSGNLLHQPELWRGLVSMGVALVVTCLLLGRFWRSGGKAPLNRWRLQLVHSSSAAQASGPAHPCPGVRFWATMVGLGEVEGTELQPSLGPHKERAGSLLACLVALQIKQKNCGKSCIPTHTADIRRTTTPELLVRLCTKLFALMLNTFGQLAVHSTHRVSERWVVVDGRACVLHIRGFG